MKSWALLGIVLIPPTLLGPKSAHAGAKAAIANNNVAVLKAASSAGSGSTWSTIIPAAISTSNNKTLNISVSLECGLYTNTTVKSQNMVSDTSSAFARVNVRVMVDGKPASPGEVVFCSRMQQLSATLQGALLSCTNMLDMSTCQTSQETISLLLETMSANAFNFAITLPTGNHNVEVQARIDTSLSSQTGTSSANATIGKGAISIEEINLIPSGGGFAF